MKRYRYFRSDRYLRESFHPRVKIFKVPFIKCYILFELSVFRFGDREDKNYYPIMIKSSMFAFKEFFKKESIIKNLYREKIDRIENFKKLPLKLQKTLKNAGWYIE